MKLLLTAALALLVLPAVAVLPARAQAPLKIPPAFLGTWQSSGLAPGASPLGAPKTELPYEEIDKKLGDFMKPWALAQHDELEWNTDDTGQVCKLDGIFRQGHGTGAGNFRFVETPDKLYQVWSSVDEHGLQRIYLNSPHPRNVSLTWNGDSRGHFVGDDTFIVDSRGFNAKSWLSSDRWIHSEELHVIERYRLYGGGAFIQLRVFVDDRLALKAPYTYTRYYRKVPDAQQGGEAICNENAPEDDLWAIRRDKLLAQHETELATFMAKYANEPLPAGPAPAPPAQTARATASAADLAKVRAIGGIYEAVPLGATVPGGLKGSGLLSDIALLADAQQTAKSRDLAFDPAKHCTVIGPFRMMAREGTKFELLTTANAVTMMFENIALGNKREIYLGRAEHPAKTGESYLGDSIGRWDGDTLVVDTVGFNDITWLNDAGAPHSASLHLVERIRPVQGGKYLEYQVTADDAKTLMKPYTYTRYYQRVTTELKEDFCEDDATSSQSSAQR